MSTKIGKTIAKEGKKILFIKSEKNKIDKRFSFYEFTIGKNNIEYLILPHFKKLNSTNMRDCIYQYHCKVVNPIAARIVR